jgi:hypothetical protein
MIYNQTFKLFAPGTVPNCGLYKPNRTLADQLSAPEDPVSMIHTYESDTPDANDVCQCGAFFFCAAQTDSQS